MFALLLKACQKDRSFADGHALPRVWDMPKTGLPLPADTRLANEIEAVNKTLADADTLGCIMKFNLSPAAREWVVSLGEKNEAARLVLALTDKYAALVMNPPYMGSGNMNAVLSNYVKKNYEAGKADLFSVFMQVAEERLAENGKYGMINLPSWLFLSIFEKLRINLINNYHIDSLLHMGRGIFGIDWGSVAFVVTKAQETTNGIYFRLHKRNFQHIYYYHIEQLFLKALADHSFKYDFDSYRDEEGRVNTFTLAHDENGLQLYYVANQQNFEKIPGCPIGYWVNKPEIFDNDSVSKRGFFSGGRNKTHDNNKYVRFFWEVSIKSDRWAKYSNAGGLRKYFGIEWEVVDWSEEAKKNYDCHGGLLNSDYWNKEGITWNLVSSHSAAFSIKHQEFIYSSGSPTIFNPFFICDHYLLGFLNTKIAQSLLKLMNPTINTTAGDVLSLPYIQSDSGEIESLVSQNISISKSDWDAHETSWDFQENELVRLSKEQGECSHRLSDLMDAYREHWTEQFLRLHANEEELNRQFIEIYGLDDELTPDVPPEEITILQQGEITIENGQIVWHNDIIVKQLISYAVGCIMGRYSLDRKGLILANQGDGQKEYEALIANSHFTIDDDGIIPLMSVNNELTDHISLRFKTWLSIAFGEENFMDNLNFVERALDKRLEDYFLKDFWKDHKKMYQNRPIYWLFSSKKGAFQCIVYMHRMNAYTAEKVRTQYLLPHIEWLMPRQAEMQANAANLSARERKELDAIGKQIDECREYHDHLHVVADRQIAFDLDDGVLVNYAKFGDVLAKLK